MAVDIYFVFGERGVAEVLLVLARRSLSLAPRIVPHAKRLLKVRDRRPARTAANADGRTKS